MKISIASDIHLEFGGWKVRNLNGSDVLILAGDILVAHALTSKKEHKAKKDTVEFLDSIKGEFNHILAIAGNHEYYNGDIGDTNGILKEEYSKRGITFLNNEVVEIDGVKFVGGTMWTNCNNRDPLELIRVKMSMNDFKYIKKDGRKFTTEDACDEFDRFVDLVRMETTDSTQNTVVISHHAPSLKSISERYRIHSDANYGYFSDLDNFVANSGVKLWVHGHTHSPSYYQLGDTTVVCNPRGYVGYEISKTSVFLPVEVEI